MFKIGLVLFTLIALSPTSGFGQACCSAGTPLLNSLEFRSTPAGIWQASITYEYNYLNDVLSGSSEIQGIRQRVSQAVLFEASYGINGRFSVSGLVSFLNQERRLNRANSEDSFEEVSTRGMGDAVLLVKYNIVPLTIIRQRQLAIGLGIKAPTAKSGLKLNGVLLPADMQPGTGAWDGILWSYFYQGFLPRKINVFGSASYRFTTKNDRYKLAAENFKGYKFGNELVISAGGSYRTLANFDFTSFLRYRTVGQDNFGDGDVVNTGGQWLYLVPGINYNFNRSGLRLSAQIPLYRKLKGVQLTTSYTVSATIFYTF